MTRLARVVVPGWPHHVTARGNRREPIFFEEGDHEVYLDLFAERILGRRLARRAPGRKSMVRDDGQPMLL